MQSPQDCVGKKHLSPERQRSAAEKVKAELQCSGRAVSRWLGVSRSVLNYQPKRLPERKQRLEAEIVRVSKAHPTLGYKKIAAKLRALGLRVNKKQVQRVRRQEGLQVPLPKPKRSRQGRSTGLPQKSTHRNHVWAWDFVSDHTERGGAVRTFNLIDEYTRECHCIWANRSIKSEDVLSQLKSAIELNGAPEFIRSDNGSEFIATVIQRWLKDNGIKTIYIEPGCPWQNGYAESFNSRFRQECLNREVLYTLRESRVVFEDWRRYYNTERPHRSLGLQTPSQFANIQPRQGSGSSRATPSFLRTLENNQYHQPFPLLKVSS